MCCKLTFLLCLVLSVFTSLGPAPAQDTKLIKVPSAILDSYLGCYQTAKSGLFSIGRTESRLILHEPRTGRVRGLEPLSETTFRAGPSLGIYTPTEFEVEFIKKDKAGLPELRMKSAAAVTIIAEKVKLYHEEAVTFRSGQGQLAGTLLTPATAGPHPAVILLHGSGPQDRNGYLSILRHAADHFARHGIAALIYDKRGVGASTGDWATAGFDDMAADAIAALQMLQTRKDIRPKQIGLWGSSQAGWVMAKATAVSNNIAFVISVSTGGSGYTVAQQEVFNVTSEMREEGFIQDEIAEVIATRQLLFDFVRTGATDKYDAAIGTASRKARIKDWLTPPSSQIDRGKRDHWFLALDIDFDPVPLWERFPGPVLGLYGELDTSTPVSQVMPIFARSLARRKNTDFTIKVFPKAHHIFLEATTGSDSELKSLKRYVPGYFETMTDWLKPKLRER
jgi:pimeloyl-ACP methyl ester carboxylesterase